MADNEDTRNNDEIKKGKGAGKGAHLKGKGGPNNFKNPNSKQYTKRSRSEVQLERNQKIRDMNQILKFAQDTESIKILANGQENALSMDAHAAWAQLQKAIKGDTQAYKAWVETTRGIRQNHVMQDNNGNNVSIFEKLIISGAKLV